MYNYDSVHYPYRTKRPSIGCEFVVALSSGVFGSSRESGRICVRQSLSLKLRGRIHGQEMGAFSRNGRPDGVNGAGWASPQPLLQSVSGHVCTGTLLCVSTSVQFRWLFIRWLFIRWLFIRWLWSCRNQLCTSDG